MRGQQRSGRVESETLRCISCKEPATLAPAKNAARKPAKPRKRSKLKFPSCDVSHDALRIFVNYLYTAEACLDEQMACDLSVLAEKYEVKQHLKAYREKFLVSKFNWDNSVPSYAFAHQHNAMHMAEAALSLITDNMDKLTKREEYEDPRLVVEIYEAYLSKQVNTAAPRIL